MAREVLTFSATIPPGTRPTAPVSTAMPLGTRIVERVEFVVPSGLNGLVGFALKAGGTIVVPFGSAQWIVASGETFGWDLEDQIQSGAWQLTGYNNGVYPHTIQVRFLLSLPQLPKAQLQPIPNAMLSGTL
jgi:hypothetical protein